MSCHQQWRKHRLLLRLSYFISYLILSCCSLLSVRHAVCLYACCNWKHSKQSNSVIRAFTQASVLPYNYGLYELFDYLVKVWKDVRRR